MNLEQRKAELLQYVLEGMSEYDFERANKIAYGGESMGFTTYQKFVKHQRKLISQFDEGSLGTMKFLRDNIMPMAEIMDKEDMFNYDAAGYCFSKSNKIVFFRER